MPESGLESFPLLDRSCASCFVMSETEYLLAEKIHHDIIMYYAGKIILALSGLLIIYSSTLAALPLTPGNLELGRGDMKLASFSRC
jgi:hypothetical protein